MVNYSIVVKIKNSGTQPTWNSILIPPFINFVMFDNLLKFPYLSFFNF